MFCMLLIVVMKYSEGSQDVVRMKPVHSNPLVVDYYFDINFS